MRRHPSAARQWPGNQRDNAPVFELDGFLLGAPFGNLLKARRDILVRIAGERAALLAEQEKLTQRHATAQLFAAQRVHLDVTHVAEDKPGSVIKHAQALSHVVECNPRQQIAVALRRKRHQSADPQRRKCHEPAQDGAPGDGDGVQGTENSIETNQAKGGNPNAKADGAGPDDEPPLTKSLSQSVTEKHSQRARIDGPRLSAEAFF